MSYILKKQAIYNITKIEIIKLAIKRYLENLEEIYILTIGNPIILAIYYIIMHI